MTPLYTQDEFIKIKYTDTLPLLCEYCGNKFYATKHQINKVVKNKKTAACKFCSKKCYGLSSRKRQTISCLECDNEVIKLSCHITKNNFCSQSCSAKYHNKHKSFGTRISKLELWLQNQLTTRYKTLDFRFNSKDDIESELDIFIPSLRLAFELNGIFHYEPIYGLEKLEQIQRNDICKFTNCIGRGIELCLIDTSSQKKFTEQSSKKFLDIICNIIDKRKGSMP